jgi:iron(II)-dependent oxidoreductase
MSAQPHARVERDGPVAVVAHGISPGRLAERMEAVRARTALLVDQLSDDALNAVHSPLMSPIAWDLGHIATFEDLWLAQAAFGRPPLREELGGVYDPAAAPRSERGELPFLRSEDVFAYMSDVRERVLDLLDGADLSPSGGRLLEGAFVYEMVLRHEQQHTETILQTLQIMTSDRYAPVGRRPLPAPGERPRDMALVPGGGFEMGAPPDGFAYDNERPRHVARTAPFLVDRTPVTNGDFLEFVEDGGYARPDCWSPEGREWRARAAAEAPAYWRRDGDGWQERSFSRWVEVDPDLPVCHVSWFEADAYARWAGKRLPTEAEWEKAAAWDPATGESRPLPWSERDAGPDHANLDQLGWGRAPAGACAAGESPVGMRQAIGDVWEWTASGFDGYPGFEAFPYPEYSQDFFGGPFRVLRGGSWATQAGAVTATFRNWDHPQRRQIFAGFRCAQGAEA